MIEAQISNLSDVIAKLECELAQMQEENYYKEDEKQEMLDKHNKKVAMMEEMLEVSKAENAELMEEVEVVQYETKPCESRLWPSKIKFGYCLKNKID